MNTLIITPTYNERKNIENFIKKVFRVNPDYHLLIIDDNSPDKTAKKIKKMQLSYQNLHLKERPEKAGLGTAYVYGFNWALSQGYDIIVQMDADLSHDPQDIPKLITKLENNDLIIGSRYVNGVSVVNWPIQRLLLSYGANIYSKIITGMPIQDSTGGFKVWRGSLLNKIEISKVKSQGYSFQIEMNFRAWRLTKKIAEESIIFVDRTIGESKMSKSIMYEAIWMVWRLRIWKILSWI